MSNASDTGAISFQYFLQPNQVVAGSTDLLTFSFLNAATAPAGSVVVQLQFPTTLVSAANAGNISPTAITPGWTATKVQTAAGWTFKVFPTTSATTLAPGAAVQVTLASVTFEVQTGPGEVLVGESSTLGAGTTSVALLVQPAPLSITASVSPATVGLGDTTVITWAASGGNQVVISGSGDPIVVPLSGSGPVYTGHTTVLPIQSAAQTIFQVAVQTPDHQQAATSVAVQLSGPVFDTFTLSPPGPYGTHDTATLTWAVRYATTVSLVTNGGAPQNLALSGAMPIVPGRYLVGVQPSYTLVLRANGFGGQTSQSQLVAFDPAAILWLRYTDPAGTSATFSVENASGLLSNGGSGNYTVTATGPGGPVVQSIGPANAGPQVLTMSATPSPSPVGGPVTLAWTTANATALRLDPGAISIPATAVASGTQTVTPTETTVYVLTAFQGENSISSQLTVIVGS